MTNQVAKIKPVDEVRNNLVKMQEQFQMALPPQISPDKFVRVVMTAVGQSPGLINANRQTLYASCMKAAQDGLLPDGREAALVMFGKDVAYMPMVGGILKKVRNSGELASITSQMVYKNDRFRFWIDGDGEHIDHEPLMFGERGDAIGVYALAKTKDGAIYIEVMDKAQVMAVKGASRAKSGPWTGSFEHEMWRKTAIRRLAKRLPMSTDLEAVIRRDDDLYDLEPAATTDGKATTKPRKLGKIIKDKTEEPVETTAVEVEPEPEKEEGI
jgi:recombination protein RecT